MSPTKLLTLIWWIWGVLLILLMVVLSNLPLFGTDVRAAWEWFVPNLLPVMGLVGGIQFQASKGGSGSSGAGAAGGAATAASARKPSWPISLALSILYLLLLSVALVSALASPTPLETLRMSNLWLGPLLALNTAALGVLFAQE